MKLTFYLKSGNKIVLRNVKEYVFKTNGNEIVGVSIKRGPWPMCPRLLVNTLDLSQVEAVVAV